MNKYRIEDIKQAIHKADLALRPYIVFVHPDDEEAIKSAMPEIESKIVVQTIPYLEKGKAICMKREELESYSIPRLLDFDD